MSINNSMICKNENCNIEFDKPYGFGEFCSTRCAIMPDPYTEEDIPPPIEPEDNDK